MLAGILFRKEPFFRGADNRDQLVKIAQVLGTDRFDAWMDKYGMSICTHLIASHMCYSNLRSSLPCHAGEA